MATDSPFRGMSVEQAQKAARALVAKMGEGVDVQAARRAQKHEQTVKGLGRSGWLNVSIGAIGRHEDKRRWKRFLLPWANRKLSAVRKSDVQVLFAKVTTENGKYAANRLLALIKSMFHKAADMGHTGPDPTAGVKKHREEKRDRFLHSEELQGFFRALNAESNATLRDLLLMALLTGVPQGQRAGHAVGAN